MASAGDLTFNPVSDTLIGSDGKPFEFSDPSGHELPRDYDPGQDTFYPPLAFGDSFQHTSPGGAKRRGRYILYINRFVSTLSESRGQALQRCSRWLPSQTRSASIKAEFRGILMVL
ncbi:hypothetical protein K503DRAFT_859347 [Rhizopogon vinicolor AM-OR11-026]|uniref:Uncharacterized protein n=1 Tax=Rhizopogon vinicolor AM-OR11-026 TaxID=1314800 RepID=A0A1B7MNP4_9AGAM|nr:hypothetical protein K503DRAFT_859347 [Rhizopogon vinicolor AM-OR11-026]